jgi:CIC family chloride channel protein
MGGFMLLLYVCKLFATSVSLGSGASGGIFSPSLYMGATLGGAFATAATMLFPGLPISVPAFAMVGMGAMVGGGTGAAMTAVVMVFEMTRNYDIVLPMILAVAVALAVRRMVSIENIYTMKLVRRGHPIPRALHANMFLVRGALEAMERDFMLIDENATFDDFVQQSESTAGMRHVVITRGQLIVGVLRVNTDLRRTVGDAAHNVTMGVLARRNYTIVRTNAVVFDIIARLSRRKAIMAIVIEGAGRPRVDKILGVITKEHIADEVASSLRMYPR